MGYTLKDGDGGGCKAQKPWFMNRSNFAEGFASKLYDSWYAVAGNTAGWAWEKVDMCWTGGGDGSHKTTLKKSNLIPQLMHWILRWNLQTFDVTFLKRLCWMFSHAPYKYTLDPSLVLGSYGSLASEIRLEALSIVENDPSTCLQSTQEVLPLNFN